MNIRVFARMRWLVAVAMIVVIAAAPDASVQPLKLDTDAATLISDLEISVPELMKKGRVPGLQVAVIRDGKIAWHKSFGVKNAESGAPVTDETIFEAASLTKPLFGYLVMLLAQEGLLNLDTPLIAHFSAAEIEEFLGHPIDEEGFHREWAEVITPRHVLSHSAGTPHGEEGDVFQLFFEPGTKYKYSAVGYYWLQMAVVQLTGEPLETTVQKRVIDPLGMTHSSMVWRDDYESAMAIGHNRFGQSQAIRRYTEPHAAASLYTTAADYARFVCAVINGEGLASETLKEMLTPQIDVDTGLGVTWSLGFGMQEDSNGPAIWQWGDYGIFRNYILAYPRQKLGVVYLTNAFTGLGLCRDMISETIGGQALGITHLEYLQYDAPLRIFSWAVQDQGAGAVEKLLPKMKAEYPDEFTVEAIGRLGRQFNEAGMEDTGIAMLEFNVKEEPDSPRVAADLARAYVEQGDRDKARRYYARALKAPKDDDFDPATVQWAIAYMNALDEPVSVPVEFLETLAGDYETRHFELRDDGLYYLRGDAATQEFRKLTAMSRDMFLIEGLVFFRLQFELDDKDRPTKVVGQYETGYRDQSMRDK